MRKVYLLLLTLTTVAFFGFIAGEGTDKPDMGLLPGHNFDFRVNAWDRSGIEKDIKVPEITTLRAADISSSKVVLEARVQKYEYIDGPKPERTGNKEFRGGVLVQDGRIVLVPRTGQYVGEYYTSTNTVRQTARHGQEGGFGMGVVLDDGYTVILTPRGSRNVGIYDARTQTYRDGATHGQKTDNAFLGSVKVSSDLIVFGPLFSEVIGLYNPQTDSYTNGPRHNEADEYAFSIIIQSSKTGKIIFTPFNSKHVGIYDAENNTYTSGARHDAHVLNAYSGCVELENGNILMSPRDAAHVGIYDPVNDIFIKGPEHREGKGAFMESEQMPGGEVIMAPFRSDNVGIYDPATGEYYSGPSVAQVPGKEIGRFSSAVLTQSKDTLIMTNRDANVIGLVRVNPFFRQGNKARVFFQYREKGKTQWQQTPVKKISEPGIFRMKVTKLNPDTDYEYRSVIRVNLKEFEGRVQSFKTPAT